MNATIRRIYTEQEFVFDAQLAAHTFAGVADLVNDVEDIDIDAPEFVFVAEVDGQQVGYASGKYDTIWCIEVAPEFRGQGIARALALATGASEFGEVCSDEGAALAEALGWDYEDCRESDDDDY